MVGDVFTRVPYEPRWGIGALTAHQFRTDEVTELACLAWEIKQAERGRPDPTECCVFCGWPPLSESIIAAGPVLREHITNCAQFWSFARRGFERVAEHLRAPELKSVQYLVLPAFVAFVEAFRNDDDVRFDRAIFDIREAKRLSRIFRTLPPF
jgi:hypothetical protein